MQNHKIITIAAPSGSGKSTITRFLMQQIPTLQFSVSAATRQPRGDEKNGEAYYFISIEEFEHKIEKNEFAEWEKVYEGKYYGTLHSEIERIWQLQNVPLLDVDVKGALSIKQQYSTNVCDIFIQVPSLEILRQRLIDRGTETPNSLTERMTKASYEMSFAKQFTHQVVNDNLDKACKDTLAIVTRFLAN